jgi:A/G-specific adenine glycosylase
MIAPASPAASAAHRFGKSSKGNAPPITARTASADSAQSMSASPILAGSPAAPLQAAFATRLIAWQRTHGRHDLPWQNTRDPYRIWLSEIMLQQTQVSTVIPYYGKFLARFPDVAALARARVVAETGP